MEDQKKPLQKWKRKMRQEQAEANIAIYPHYHCQVCDKMIEKGESYETILKVTDKGMAYKNYCSQECYEKVTGKSKKKTNRKIWIFWVIIAAVLGVITLLAFTLT